MLTYTSLYPKIYSYENLRLAYKRARKGKSKKDYVIDFEKDLENNLLNLKNELMNKTYSPKPLKTFIIRDPKLRKISKSEFRDRIIHHALFNIIEPIFDKTFIYDSYANRKNKGTSNASSRLQNFIRRASKNNHKKAYCLRCDIRHYFENVNHDILINIIKKKVKDSNVINLIELILKNHYSEIGMPLGNLTSQFFANIYLNELDYFIKHKLKIKYYIKYVGDFVILSCNKSILEFYEREINNFLKTNLDLELHNEKSKIISLNQGIIFLGFRYFYHYKLLKKNKRKGIKDKLELLIRGYKESNDYNKMMQGFESILAYLENANTFRLRMKIINYFTTFKN
jgi:retron-type reverse transcriptase